MRLRLPSGDIVLIDTADYSRVARFKWKVCRSHRGLKYAACSAGKKMIFLHRLLLRVRKPKVVDHANGNGLDNRRKNLRSCSFSQNKQNGRAYRKRAAIHSRFKGVSFSGGRWVAHIQKNNKLFYLGAYSTERDAARVYDFYAAKKFGRFAKFNFTTDTKQKRFRSVQRRVVQCKTTPFRGVSWDAERKVFRMSIYDRTKGTPVQLRFATAVDAAREYDQQARELFGEKAKLNFPTRKGA